MLHLFLFCLGIRVYDGMGMLNVPKHIASKSPFWDRCLAKIPIPRSAFFIQNPHSLWHGNNIPTLRQEKLLKIPIKSKKDDQNPQPIPIPVDGWGGGDNNKRIQPFITINLPVCMHNSDNYSVSD